MAPAPKARTLRPADVRRAFRAVWILTSRLTAFARIRRRSLYPLPGKPATQVPDLLKRGDEIWHFRCPIKSSDVRCIVREQNCSIESISNRGGGQGRNRTADASLFRAALYQLSYLAVANLHLSKHGFPHAVQTAPL